MRKCTVGGEDRQLAGSRAVQLAVDADDVAQVEALGQLPVLLADLLLADEHLDRAGPIVDVDEHRLAGRRRRTMRPAARTLGPCCGACAAASARLQDRDFIFPSGIAPIGMWPSNRPPQGSTPKLLDLAEFFPAGGLQGGSADQCCSSVSEGFFCGAHLSAG